MHVPAQGLAGLDLQRLLVWSRALRTRGSAGRCQRRCRPPRTGLPVERKAGAPRLQRAKHSFAAQLCTHKPRAAMQYGDTPQWQLLQQGETGRGCSFSPSGAASSSGGAAIVTRCHCSLPLHCCAATSSPLGRREGVTSGVTSSLARIGLLACDEAPGEKQVRFKQSELHFKAARHDKPAGVYRATRVPSAVARALAKLNGCSVITEALYCCHRHCGAALEYRDGSPVICGTPLGALSSESRLAAAFNAGSPPGPILHMQPAGMTCVHLEASLELLAKV